MNSFATNEVCTQDTLCSRDLMEETVNVMNRALHEGSAHGNRTGGRALGQWISNGKTLRIHVFSARHMTERETVDIRFDEEQVRLVDPDREATVDGSMTVTEEHLAQVHDNPQAYVDHPLRMELIWVKNRMTAPEA